MDYAYASRSPNASVPSYYNLMTATDQPWTELGLSGQRGQLQVCSNHAAKEPDHSLVGDFAGPKAIKSGRATVSQRSQCGGDLSFYFPTWKITFPEAGESYKANLAALPVEPSGLFIRFRSPVPTLCVPSGKCPLAGPAKTGRGLVYSESFKNSRSSFSMDD
jgi:hypothetical protein